MQIKQQFPVVCECWLKICISELVIAILKQLELIEPRFLYLYPLPWLLWFWRFLPAREAVVFLGEEAERLHSQYRIRLLHGKRHVSCLPLTCFQASRFKMLLFQMKTFMIFQIFHGNAATLSSFSHVRMDCIDLWTIWISVDCLFATLTCGLKIHFQRHRPWPFEGLGSLQCFCSK